MQKSLVLLGGRVYGWVVPFEDLVAWNLIGAPQTAVARYQVCMLRLTGQLGIDEDQHIQRNVLRVEDDFLAILV